MFKSFNTSWLKPALLRVFQSGWTLLVLVGLSLLFCDFHGRHAFLVWWCALTGTILIGFSVFLGNLPYRLLKGRKKGSRLTEFFSWIIWCVGVIFISISSLFAQPLLLIWLSPVGVGIGFMFCLWVSRKGLLAWIQ